MSIQTHISFIQVKVTSLREAEHFYDLLFTVIGLTKKENQESGIIYWGDINIMLFEQQQVMAYIDPRYRLGAVHTGIRVGSKDMVDGIYRLMYSHQYRFEWKPKRFDYTDHYYSTLVFDPDDNKWEFIFDL